MADGTHIEWCDATFNPWVGCTKVSPACDHCYAEGWAKRTGHPELWTGERRRTTASYWQQPLKWDRQAQAAGIRKRVFCASLADVFDNQVPTRWRDDLWFLIDRTPNLDWLLLTKRPQNIAKMLPDPRTGIKPWGDGWSNVWLGTTTENQEEADRRIPELFKTPAKRFISAEPLLSALDIRQYLGLAYSEGRPARGIIWCICGGESGPGARPMHPDWPRALRDQCAAAGVPYFFKQWGEWAPIAEWSGHLDGGRFRRECAIDLAGAPVPHDINPDDIGGHRCALIGKYAAGALLDGRKWSEFPP